MAVSKDDFADCSEKWKGYCVRVLDRKKEKKHSLFYNIVTH